MFDKSSRELLKSAPDLPGLKADVFDELLTQAHIDLATIRLQQAEGDPVSADQTFDRVRRLASTFEAYVALDLQAERTKAAAFVAATAHQIMVRARAPAPGQTTILSTEVVDSSIASTLLFLIAERSADAVESARLLRARGEDRAIRRSIIISIRELALGRLGDIVERDFDGDRLDDDDSTEYAADLLFRECGHAIQVLAREALGEDFEDEAAGRLARVIALAGTHHEEMPTFLGGTAQHQFSGPHHLAVLLNRLIGNLQNAMVVKIPVPLGSGVGTWSGWLKEQAKKRPFLWTNHIAAIKLQYLDRGRSMVMTSPTGSGKTTLSVLKIAATLCSGKSVVYLAPTHALVDQVQADLTDQVASLQQADAIEELSLEELGEKLPPLSVMTPERCLALLGFAPDLFRDVGLLVFDEFHLISADDPNGARLDGRAIDAMLALLTFMARQRDADLLLLSAMVSNGEEIRNWLAFVTGRPVEIFDDPWKPTRQLRSCVIYDDDEVAEAVGQAKMQLTKTAQGRVPTSPYGLFSLIPGWHPKRKEKLVVRAMSAKKPPLARKDGRLTANRNIVAAQIAADYVAAGKRVVVFCSDIKGCGSVAKEINQLTSASQQALEGEQLELRDAILAEVGAREAMFDASGGRAAVHHGDMLPIERRLAEGLFRILRESGMPGLDAIAATSTVAQGLNLPCDVVILAGTDRSVEDDPTGNPRQDLKPHEILNAVGRAGRASYAATGIGIVIPGRPIRVDMKALRFGQNTPLPIVFSEADACEAIADPIELLLDRIEADPGLKAQSMIRRLSDVSENADFGFERIVRRSFGYFLKNAESQPNADLWLESRRKALIAAEKQLNDPEVLDWQKQIAVRNGVPPSLIERLTKAIPKAPTDSGETADWMNWLLAVLAEVPEDVPIVLREASLESVFGRAYDEIMTSREDAAAVIIAALQHVIKLWCGAAPLVEIDAWLLAFIRQNEGKVVRQTIRSKHAARARRFAMRIASDLGFICGLLGQVYQGRSNETLEEVPPIVDLLPQMIRNGDRNRHHLAVRALNTMATRVTSHKLYEELILSFTAGPAATYDQVRDEVEMANIQRLFQDLSDQGDNLN